MTGAQGETGAMRRIEDVGCRFGDQPAIGHVVLILASRIARGFALKFGE
jgi:hypothetical protein